ncbi:MAG: ATP-binding cassette domain-containing protein [Casimicrobiaceae bacterium]
MRIQAGTRMLIDALDVSVEPGECVTVLGPTGSGKSALLGYIAGTIGPGLRVRGRVSIDGEDIRALAPAKRGVGMMFQDDLLFPQLSVGGNLLFALVPSVRGRAARREAVERALREIGLEGCAELRPDELAAHERARVSLMRTLLAQPRLLLLDEPFRRFGAALKDRMRRLVFEHARRRGLPVLLATRERTDAEAVGGRVVIIAADQPAVSAAVTQATREPSRRVRVA